MEILPWDFAFEGLFLALYYVMLTPTVVACLVGALTAFFGAFLLTKRPNLAIWYGENCTTLSAMAFGGSLCFFPIGAIPVGFALTVMAITVLYKLWSIYRGVQKLVVTTKRIPELAKPVLYLLSTGVLVYITRLIVTKLLEIFREREWDADKTEEKIISKIETLGKVTIRADKKSKKLESRESPITTTIKTVMLLLTAILGGLGLTSVGDALSTLKDFSFLVTYMREAFGREDRGKTTANEYMVRYFHEMNASTRWYNIFVRQGIHTNAAYLAHRYYEEVSKHRFNLPPPMGAPGPANVRGYDLHVGAVIHQIPKIRFADESGYCAFDNFILNVETTRHIARQQRLSGEQFANLCSEIISFDDNEAPPGDIFEALENVQDPRGILKAILDNLFARRYNFYIAIFMAVITAAVYIAVRKYKRENSTETRQEDTSNTSAMSRAKWDEYQRLLTEDWDPYHDEYRDLKADRRQAQEDFMRGHGMDDDRRGESYNPITIIKGLIARDRDNKLESAHTLESLLVPPAPRADVVDMPKWSPSSLEARIPTSPGCPHDFPVFPVHGDGGEGTGWFTTISSHTVLVTAYHVGLGRDITVTLGSSPTRCKFMGQSGDVAVFDPIVKGEEKAKLSEHIWKTVPLPSDAMEHFLPLSLVARSPKIAWGGHSYGKRPGTSEYGHTYLYTCSSNPGDSGAPVLIADGSNGFRVCGVHTGSFDKGKTNEFSFLADHIANLTSSVNNFFPAKPKQGKQNNGKPSNGGGSIASPSGAPTEGEPRHLPPQ
jgi:hypothetical protein